MNKHLLALAATALCASAWAASPQAASAPPAPDSHYNDTAKAPHGMAMRTDHAADDQRDQLEEKLKSVSSRAGYKKELEADGYRISAINADKPDYLEYEVVKGKKSYEVQLDFDHNATKATKIDVAHNMWRADSTKRMLADAKYKPSSPLVADPKGRYSDRHHMKAWTDEKGRLEDALPKNQTVAAYKKAIEKRGYKITSVNDHDADHVEYEIVKGDNSYEVQIKLDPKTRLGTDVDVASNAWDAEGTERQKDKNEAMATPHKR